MHVRHESTYSFKTIEGFVRNRTKKLLSCALNSVFINFPKKKIKFFAKNL